jgi:hypothetical protein
LHEITLGISESKLFLIDLTTQGQMNKVGDIQKNLKFRVFPVIYVMKKVEISINGWILNTMKIIDGIVCNED